MDSASATCKGQWRLLGPVMGGSATILDVAIVPQPGEYGQQALFAVSTTRVYRAQSNELAWRAVGTNIQNVRLQSLAASPDFQHDRTLFVGGIQGGLYRSADAGETWRCLDRWPAANTVTSIALSPDYAVDRTLLVGTLEEGVFLSSDEGRTWKPVNFGLSRSVILDLVCSPNFGEDEIAFAVTEKGLYWTRNAARAWRPVRGFPSASPQCVVFSPAYAQDQTVFAASEDMGILRAEDGGRVWTVCGLGQSDGEGALTHPINGLAVSPHFVEDHTLFAATADGQVLVSQDRGERWELLAENLPPISCLSISPNYARDGLLLIGTVNGGLFISADRGHSWQSTGKEICLQPATALALSSDEEGNAEVFVLVPERGVAHAEDVTGEWDLVFEVEDELANCMAAPPIPGAVSPTLAKDRRTGTVRTLFVGTTGRLLRSSDGGQNWTTLSLPVEASTMRSVILSPEFGSDGQAWIAVATRHLLHSEDGGQQWEPLPAPGCESENVIQLACSPGMAEEWLLFVATFEARVGMPWGTVRVYRTADNDTTWRRIVETETVTPWAAFAFWKDTKAGGGPGQYCGIVGIGPKVFTLPFTEGVEGTATSLGSDALSILSLIAINCPDGEPQVIAGTNQGVYRSQDGGHHWEPCNEGLEDSIIVDLAIPPVSQGKTVIALSVTGHLWELSLPPHQSR